MIKGLLIYINILFLSAISFFSGAEVTASAVAPGFVKQGESFDVTLTINKGSEVTGFSKIQYDLPTGAQVQAIDVKGGDLKVVNNVLKIQWIGTPSTPTIVVKFKVTLSSETSGSVNLSGIFSYILEGQRKDVYFNPLTIQVTSNSTAQTTTTTAPNTASTTTSNNSQISNSTITNNPVSSTTTSTSASNGTVTVKRTLSTNTVKAGESFTVEITVNKNDFNGFAKIQDNLPTGFIAEEIESFGGQFTNAEEKAKILWITVPSASTFKVKYKVTLKGVAKGRYKIDGFFSYMPDQQADIKVDLGYSEINVVEENTVIANNTPAEQTPVNTTNSTPEKTSPAAQSNTTTNSTAKTKPIEKTATVEIVEKEKPSKTSTTSPETEKSTETIVSASTTKRKSSVTSTPAVINNPGATNNNQELFYSVQICALKRATDVSYFETNHSVKEKIFVQMHEGWHKYTIGEFKEYKEARNHRENVKSNNKILGPFVTAYNKGVRITVQEALMISKQQWVQ